MKQNAQGFTIVELLIVIVVIAILAVISVVAYTGIQNRAHNTAVQSDLRNIGSRLLQDQTLHPSERPPLADQSDLAGKIKVSKNSYNTASIAAGMFIYCRNDTQFALLARAKTNVTYVFKSTGSSIGTTSNSGNRDTLCAAGDVPSGSPGYAAIWIIHNTNYAPDVWAPWIE